MKKTINLIIGFYDFILSVLFSALSDGDVTFFNGKIVYVNFIKPEDLEE